MSLFVVGHDCGHTTFSNYTWLERPQKSHRKHHQHTSHVEKDLSHPWITKQQWEEWGFVDRHFRKIPVAATSGRTLRLFSNNKERVQCVVSGAACAFCAYIAFVLCQYSLVAFLKYYYVPVMFFSLWLMMVTFLQHKDEEIKAFEEGTWTYVQGQSETIDRRYGLGIDWLMHHINRWTPTEAIRPILEKHGLYKSRTNFDHLFEFLRQVLFNSLPRLTESSCRLNVKLEYMLSVRTGVLKYSVSKDFQKKTT
ncbi:Omega-6 fatty acid desaturase, endoplasmic reticulum isozyme 1 [Aphelenchoides fujianensis]|nr:Omega-6 fatty acid desaturase, endoplasmic reticulum isozyme 1 [Aphelenchoides fujianensis]